MYMYKRKLGFLSQILKMGLVRWPVSMNSVPPQIELDNTEEQKVKTKLYHKNKSFAHSRKKRAHKTQKNT